MTRSTAAKSEQRKANSVKLFALGFSLFALHASQPLQAATPAPEPRTLTLGDALLMARQKNVDLTMATYNLREFESQYRQAIGGALPNLNLSAGYVHNFDRPNAFFSGGKIETGIDNGFDASVRLEQPLFTGGKVITAIQGAKHALTSQQNRVQQTQEDIDFAVKNLFYNALFSSATALIQDDNLASTQDHLNTVQQRYRQGLDSDLIVQRQQVEVAAAKAQQISVKNAHEMALISLQDTLTLDVDRPIRLIGTLDPPRGEAPPYDEVERLALSRHPGLKAAREDTQAYGHLVKIYKADMLPHLNLVGRYDWMAQSNSFAPTENQQATAFNGGLRLDYPLFTGGDRLEKVRQSKINFDRAKEREAQTERSIRIDVRRQWLAIIEALERARAQETSIEAARSALKSTEIRYKAGQSGLLDLNDATISLNQIRTRYIMAARDYWVSLAALERAIGGPLPGAKP